MRNRMIIPLLLAVAAAAIYRNTLQTPFIFDDFEHIRQNTALRIEALTVNNLLDAASSPA